MNTPVSLRILSAAMVALLAFSCGSPSTKADAGSETPDAGAGGGTGGGSGGGTGGGTDGGTDGGSGTGTVTVGPSCVLGGADTCGQGESCILVEMGTQKFEPHCMLGGCDLVDQDCSGGQACGYSVVNNVVGRACIAPGNRKKGESCGQSVGNCATGLICAGLQTGGASCRQFCEKDTDCGTDEACAFMISVQGSDERPLTCVVTADACDVLLQNCPVATDGCYLTQSGAQCLPAGTATVGQPCDATTLCEKGASCISTSAGPTPTFECARLCGFPSSAPTCPAGTCQQLASPSGPLLDGGVGACR